MENGTTETICNKLLFKPSSGNGRFCSSCSGGSSPMYASNTTEESRWRLPSRAMLNTCEFDPASTHSWCQMGKQPCSKPGMSMMPSSNGNIFRVTGPLCREFSDWSPMNSPHKGQWRGALMFYLICAWINVGDLRRHCAHCDVTVVARTYVVITLQVVIGKAIRCL